MPAYGDGLEIHETIREGVDWTIQFRPYNLPDKESWRTVNVIIERDMGIWENVRLDVKFIERFYANDINDVEWLGSFV